MQGHLLGLALAHRMVEQLAGDVAHLAPLIAGTVEVVIEEAGQRIEWLLVQRGRTIVRHGDGFAGACWQLAIGKRIALAWRAKSDQLIELRRIGMLLIELESTVEGTIECSLYRRLAVFASQIDQIPVVGGIAFQHLLARIPALLQRPIDRQTLVHRVTTIEYQEGKGVEVSLAWGVSRIFGRQIVVQVDHDVGRAGSACHHGQPLSSALRSKVVSLPGVRMRPSATLRPFRKSSYLSPPGW